MVEKSASTAELWHQVRRLNLQGAGKLFNRFEGGGALRPLDERDRGAVQAGAETELLLRDPAGEADLPDTLSKICGEWARFHWPNGR